MADENPTTPLSDMSDEQIIALVNQYNEMNNEGILDTDNLDDLPQSDITNLMVGMMYLTNSGLLNCEIVFPELWKKVSNEFGDRLGDAPLTQNPVAMGNIPTGTDPLAIPAEDEDAVTADDYTDSADADEQAPITPVVSED